VAVKIDCHFPGPLSITNKSPYPERYSCFATSGFTNLGYKDVFLDPSWIIICVSASLKGVNL